MENIPLDFKQVLTTDISNDKEDKEYGTGHFWSRIFYHSFSSGKIMKVTTFLKFVKNGRPLYSIYSALWKLFLLFIIILSFPLVRFSYRANDIHLKYIFTRATFNGIFYVWHECITHVINSYSIVFTKNLRNEES